jgi:ATPase subunit of ABC transporter with duplicated ATPase domains
LLDEAITRVLHLDRADEDSEGLIVEYRGTYTQYLVSREADEARQAKKATQQSKEIERLQRVVDRFGAKASKAAMAHSIEKRIGRIEETRVHAARGARVLKVRFPEPPHCGETVLTVDGLRKTFGGPDIFHDVSFDLGRGERLLVLGLNGAGKTSLLRILAGEVKPDNGEVKFGYNVQVGYYAQEHDNLVAQRSLVDHMRDQAPSALGLTETQLRGMLGMFGLSGDKVYQESATLSGGEKTKLALAMMMVGKNNLLLLDEPTNNLDPSSRQSVADALSSWEGAIVLVSHDAEFVEQLAPTKVLLMPDGQEDYFNESWLELVTLA